MGVHWPDDVIDRLTSLWKSGASCSRIAQKLNDRFGMGLTRNAVIGKVHRLKLASRPRKPGEPPAERAPRSDTAKASKRIQLKRNRPKWDAQTQSFEPETEPQVASVLMSDLDIPKSQRKTLMQLTEHSCRWPVGDVGAPDFFFCGAEPMKGCAYCVPHQHRSLSGSSRNISDEERARREQFGAKAAERFRQGRQAFERVAS
jgi:GcrA cell cycle regulator